MSLQKIIDSAQQITIDRSPPVAMTMSRGQYLKTAERGARIWRFVVTPSQGWRWEDYRDEIEDLDAADRISEHTINIGTSNSKLSWMTAYRGDLTTSQRTNLFIKSNTIPNQLVLNCNVAINVGQVLFRKGDYIQPFGSRYPYTVTSDVVAAAGDGDFEVSLNRSVLSTVTFGQSVSIGNAVSWRVKITKFPRYIITPGRIITWEDDFELTEVLV